MGLLDALFDPSTYGGQGGGVLPPWLMNTYGNLQQGGSPLLNPYPPAQFPMTGYPVGSPMGSPTATAGAPAPLAGMPFTRPIQPEQAGASSEMPAAAAPTGGGGLPSLSSLLGIGSAQAQPAPQQPMQQPIGSPDFGARMNAGLQGFAHGGSPIGAIANLISGIATGQRQDPQGMMLQQQAATEQAMRAAGIPAVLAHAAAQNPSVFQSISAARQLPGGPIETATYDALKAAGVPETIARGAAANPEVLKSISPKYLGEDFKMVPFGGAAINRKGEVVYSQSQGDMLLDPSTIKVMAEQARAGDTTVFQNLGRGAQGAQNIVALRKEIAAQNAAGGTSGTEQAMKNAEFFGVKSGQRTLGTKQANIDLAATEFKQVLPVVMAASDAVPRTNYPDLNKVILAFEQKTGDPNVVKFGGGVNTLINLYARAISPSGVPTVNDKEHAREILSKAWSSGQFKAAVGMMEAEINAALQSPEKVREEQRRRFLGGAAGTAVSPIAPTAPTAPAAADPLGIR